MDGDPGERGQDAHRLHRLGAALGVDGEQGVLAGAGAVHPGQPAFDPEPGLVAPGHLAAAICPRACSRNPPSLPAARAVMPATVPDDSGMPDNSASACAVRFSGRNCPAYR
jgi:hypothetical protein